MFEFKAQSVTNVNPLQFNRVGDEVIGLVANCEVNYGGTSLNHQIDLWGELTDQQKAAAQQVYNFLKQKVDSIVLGE